MYNRVKVSFILHSTRGEDYLDFRFGISPINNNAGTNTRNAIVYSPKFVPSENLQEYTLDIKSGTSGYLYVGCCAVADIYSITFYCET